jgi:phospholipid/cholesterol/gamma-HCH transport system substrate-binding protein
MELERVTVNLRRSGDLEKTTANVRATSEQLQAAVADNRALLHETLQNVNAITGTARELTTDREAQVKRTLDSIELTAHNMARLTDRLDSLRAQAQSVAARVDHGEGTLAQLVNDRKLYDDLRTSVNSLNALVEDIKKHPRKYINLSIF